MTNVESPQGAPSDAMLRPPESWPGAGGRVSSAPDVPAWPGRRTPTGGTGESWPGATPATGANTRPARAGGASALGVASFDELRLRAPANRVSPKARIVWALAAALGWLIPVAGVVAWSWFDEDHRALQGALGAVVAVAALAHIIAMPLWRYQVHRWETSPEAVYTQTGWFQQERRIAPIARVQTVDSERGPIERLFGLGTLTVTTASAAGPLKISGIEQHTVDELVAELTRITARHRGDAT